MVISSPAFEVYPNAGAHNSLYRGKYLGDHVTDAQYAEIAAGTFNDLFIGDYWTIDGRDYLIADFDYCMNFKYSGNPTPLTAHHVVMVPRNILYKQKMQNDSSAPDYKTVGYANTDMFKTGLEQAKTIIKSAFNGHILSHVTYLTTFIDADGISAGHIYSLSEVDLMNEIMVMGCRVCSNDNESLYEKTQLSLFKLRPNLITDTISYWLRDRSGNQTFCVIIYYGMVTPHGGTASNGVRPYFVIG